MQRWLPKGVDATPTVYAKFKHILKPNPPFCSEMNYESEGILGLVATPIGSRCHHIRNSY